MVDNGDFPIIGAENDEKIGTEYLDGLTDMIFSADSRTLKRMADEMWLEENPEFHTRPASVTDFITGSDYLGLDEVYTRVIIECEKVLEGGFTELIDYEGIGCHEKGAKIRMFDGRTKKVENIVVGDELIGPDAEKRVVLELKRGKEKMFKFFVADGTTFTVNRSHILSLSQRNKRKRIVNMKVGTFLSLPASKKSKMFLRKISDGIEVDVPILLVENLGDGEFYGFTLTGDHLYLDANGFVHHNSGKSYKSQILLLYKAHELLCLKNPHKYLGVSNDKSITLLNMGLSLIQAKGVVFEGMVSMITESPFFKSLGMNILSTEIAFKKQKIKIVCGSSSKTVALGLNIFGAVLDEAAFYNEAAKTRSVSSVAEAQDQAEIMYNQIKRRITSRFKRRNLAKVKPLLALISSPKHEDDFMNKKIKEVKSLNIKNSYVINLPTWSAKDREKMNEDVFIFDTETCRVLTQKEMENFLFGGNYYDVNPTKRNARILKYNNALDDRLWIIPVDFEEDFRRAPELSMRDYGAVPTSTIERFYRKPDQIKLCMYEEIENRFGIKSSLDSFDLSDPPDDLVFIHVDLGLNKIRADGSRGDFAGMAVCHFGGYDMEHGGRPVVIFDAVARISAAGGGEVDFGEIRDLIIDMKESGWNIYKVTYDSFQSTDSIQTLRKKGLLCDVLTVDRTPEQHETLKAGIYEKRVFLPVHDILHTELRQLERHASTDKVDHPRYGCFTGDTLVYLPEIGSISFEDLCNRFQNGEEFDVYTMTESGVGLGKARSPRITKYVDEIMELFLSNGQTIRCTPDHRILLLNGEYVEAKNAPHNTPLMSLHLHSKVQIKSEIENEIEIRNMHSESKNKFQSENENREGEFMVYCPVRCIWIHNEDLMTPVKNGSDQDEHIIPNCEKDIDNLVNHVCIIGSEIVKTRDPIPVYDLTVDCTQNFALSSGIFVHNSKDVADAVAGSMYTCVKFYGTKHTGTSHRRETDKEVIGGHESSL